MNDDNARISISDSVFRDHFGLLEGMRRQTSRNIRIALTLRGINTSDDFFMSTELVELPLLPRVSVNYSVNGHCIGVDGPVP